VRHVSISDGPQTNTFQRVWYSFTLIWIPQLPLQGGLTYQSGIVYKRYNLCLYFPSCNFPLKL